MRWTKSRRTSASCAECAIRAFSSLTKFPCFRRQLLAWWIEYAVKFGTKTRRLAGFKSCSWGTFSSCRLLCARNIAKSKHWNFPPEADPPPAEKGHQTLRSPRARGKHSILSCATCRNSIDRKTKSFWNCFQGFVAAHSLLPIMHCLKRAAVFLDAQDLHNSIHTMQ